MTLSRSCGDVGRNTKVGCELSDNSVTKALAASFGLFSIKFAVIRLGTVAEISCASPGNTFGAGADETGVRALCGVSPSLPKECQVQRYLKLRRLID